MKNLTITLLLGTVLAIVIATLYFYPDKNTTNIDSDVATISSTQALQVDESPQYSELTQQEINQLNFDSEAERKQRRYLEEKYNAERGYISLEEEKLYESYPNSTLQEMGKTGDIHALRELGLRAAKERNYKLSFSYFESAAIYGSTITLGYLSNEYAMANQLYLDKKNGKHALMMALSYLRTAELRGDYNYSDLINKLPAEHESSYGKISLDKNDYEEIENTAQKIYHRMESKRIELGLGQFDNTVPRADVIQMEKILAMRAKKEFGL